MTPRPSRQHYRVQTRTRYGWVTRAHGTLYLGAIAAANTYHADTGADARVVLGDQVLYSTAPATTGERRAS